MQPTLEQKTLESEQKTLESEQKTLESAKKPQQQQRASYVRWFHKEHDVKGDRFDTSLLLILHCSVTN